MDLYHIWCDLKPGVSDATLAENASKYLGHLKSGAFSEITTSSNAMPATFMASHGRNDHDE